MDIQILKEMLSEEKFNELNEALKDKEGKLADLGKSDYVSSAKYNALKTQLSDTQKLLSDKTSEYDTLKQTAGDNKELQKTIDDLKTDFETKRTELVNNYEAQLKKSKIENRIIADYKPKDIADIMPHIDLSKININDDGIAGLKEQMETLKTNKAYYFEDEKKPNDNSGGLDHKDDKDNDDPFLKGFKSQ